MYQPKQRVRITTGRWGEWDKKWGEGCELILESPASLADLKGYWHVRTVFGGVAGLVSESDIGPLTDESPVRSVQRVIPGTYDGVHVGTDSMKGCALIRLADDDPWTRMTADQLERAAAVLTALAGALRDGE